MAKAKDEVKIKFVAETNEFNEGIKKNNSDIATLNSALKLNATQLKGNANDTSLLKERQKLLADKLQESTQKVELTSKKLEKAKELYGADSEAVRIYEKELDNAKNQEEGVRNALEQCNESIRQNEESLRQEMEAEKENQSATGQLTSEIEKQEKELESLKKQYVEVVLSEGETSDKAEELAKEIKDLNQDLQEDKEKMSEAEKSADALTDALQGTSNAAQSAANGGFTVFKGVLADLASNAIQMAGAKLKDFAGSIIETGSSFEAGMSQVAAISGATGDEFTALRDKAQEMGATTKFTATESAEAMNYMAMAGWDTEQMLGGLPGILNLAAAAGEDLATTSDIVTDAMTAFGLKAGETTKIVVNGAEQEVESTSHFADVLAAASASANTNVSMLGESFKYAAPVAGALGMSAEDTSIALGLMANAGIKASQGGTALRTILTNLAKPTDAVSAAMEKMGISLDDGEGNVKSLRDVMGDLREAFGNTKISVEEYINRMGVLDDSLASGQMTQKKYDDAVKELEEDTFGAEGALKAQAAATIAGKTGMSGLLAIVNASEEDFDKLTEAVDGATDAETGYSAAAEMASTMQDNLQGDITIMQSALDGVRQHIYDDLNEPMRELVQKVTDEVIPAAQEFYDALRAGASWLNEHKTAVEAVMIVIGSLAAGITAYNVVSGVQATLTWQMVTAQLALNTAFLSSPITWWVMAIGLVIGAGVMLYKNWESVKELAGELADWVSEKFQALAEGISGFFNSIGEAVSGAFHFMKDTAIGAFQKLNDASGGKLGALKDLTVEKLNGVRDAFEENGGGLAGIAAAGMQLVKDKFTIGYDVLNVLTDGKLDELKEKVAEKFTALKDAAGEKLDGLKDLTKSGLDSVKSTFESNGGGIKGAAAVYMSGVQNSFEVGYKALNKLTGGKLDELKKTVESKLEGVKQKASEKFTAVKDLAGENFSSLKNLASKGLDKVKSTFESNGGGIKGAAAVYMSGIHDAFSTGYSALNKLTGGRLDDLKKTAEDKLESVKEKFSAAIEKIKGFFDFHIEWPHISVPSITVDWQSEGNLAKAAKLLGFPGLPKFGVKWNAEGAILTRPMIFGYAGGMLQGAGEAGPEAVLPIEKLEDYIGNKMAEFVEMIPQFDYDRLAKLLAVEAAKMNIDIYLDDRKVSRAIRRYIG